MNHRRFISQKLPSPDGKNSATVSADSTSIFRPPVSLNIARPAPEYSSKVPSAISVSASGISKGTTPIVPGIQHKKARKAGSITRSKSSDPFWSW